MAQYGLAGPSADVALVGSSTWRQRASIYGTIPVDAWIYSLSARMGRYNLDAGTVAVRLGIGWAGSGSPGTLLGYTGQINVSNAASFAGDCTQYTSAIVEAATPGSPTDLAVAMGANEPLYLTAATGVGPRLLIQMVQAGVSPFANKLLYNKDAGPIPANPMASVSNSYEGNLTIVANYDPNVKPNKPTSLTPSGVISGTGAGQLFQAAFSDPNTNRGDRLARYHVQIARVSDGVVISETTRDANPSTEVTHSKWNYDGSALPTGTSLKWRVRHADWFGAWSDFSDWTNFQLNAGAFISNVGPQAPEHPFLPKVLTTTPGSLKFKYNSLSNVNMQRYWLQLANEQGKVVRGAAEVVLNVASGTTVTAAWPAGWAPLTRGVQYKLRVSAQDVGGSLASEVDGALFWVNTIPNQPTNLEPSGSTAFTSPPLVTFDADDWDNPPTGVGALTASVKVTKSDNTWTATGTATWDAALGKWKYQVPTLPSVGTYHWEAWTTDNVETSATSAQATFIYSSGPTFSWGSPVAGYVSSSNQPVFTWSSPTQTAFRFYIVNATTGVLALDTGRLTSTIKTYTPPSGYLLNGNTYRAYVQVWDVNDLTTTSPYRQFSIDYPDIAANTNFQASPELLVGDRDATAVKLSWVKHPSDDPNKFAEYVITRETESTSGLPRPGIDELPVIVARVPSYDTEVAYDYLPASGHSYIYRLHRVMVVGGEFVASLTTSATISVSFRDCILSEAIGGLERVVLRIMTDAQLNPMDDVEFFRGWGERAGTAHVSPEDFDISSFKFELHNGMYGSAQASFNELERLRRQHTVVCFRDNRGYKIFGYIQTIYDYGELNTYVVSLKIQEVVFTEGYY